MQQNSQTYDTGPNAGSVPASSWDTAELEDELKSAEQQIRRFIQARPLITILGAAALGFIAARLLRDD